MAKTKRKRQRKHRGTPAGTIEARGRTSKPGSTRADAKSISRERRAQRAQRFDKPPTWRGSVNRAVISAAVFALAVVLIFKRPVASALFLGLAMVVVYLPMSYYTDRLLYNRRQRKKAAGSGR